MVTNIDSKIHICLNLVGDSTWLGGILYIQNLIRAIKFLPSDEIKDIKISLLTSKKNLVFIESIRELIDCVYVDQLPNRIYNKILRKISKSTRKIPLSFLNTHDYDFVYPDFWHGNAPYSWGAWVPDLQHLYLPEFFTSKEISERNITMRGVAENAQLIIVSSHHTRQCFCEHFPETIKKVHVMHFASFADPLWFSTDPWIFQKKYGLPNRFFLVSNQFWKHKDHNVIVDALNILKQKNVNPIIVCTGSTSDYRNPEYFSQLMNKVKILDLCDQFIILGMIPRSDQIQLMRQCLAVIQPSLFEGWSSVIEDARSLGKFIIASDFPVHKEQNAPNSYFFKQGDPQELATLISDGYTDFDPGINRKLEKLAIIENEKRVSTYGRRLLSIVKKTIEADN